MGTDIRLAALLLNAVLAGVACNKATKAGDTAPDVSVAVATTPSAAPSAAPSALAALTSASAAPTPAPAPASVTPAAAQHPAYLHALSDLRSARWNLERRGGDPMMKWDEHAAIEAIDRAIREIKLAAIDDGRNLDDHPPVDAEPRRGRLHRAITTLRAARADIAKQEDNAAVAGLRGRALVHIDEAIRLTEFGLASIH